MLIGVYFLIGICYGMMGEFRLGKKYGVSPWQTISSPHTYTRAVLFSPDWPLDLYWTIHHCGNPFGCLAAELE